MDKYEELFKAELGYDHVIKMTDKEKKDSTHMRAKILDEFN